MFTDYTRFFAKLNLFSAVQDVSHIQIADLKHLGRRFVFRGLNLQRVDAGETAAGAGLGQRDSGFGLVFRIIRQTFFRNIVMLIFSPC